MTVFRCLFVAVLCFIAGSVGASDRASDYKSRFAVEPYALDSDFNFTDKDGMIHKLQEYYSQDRIIILNFWATWCLPCVNEMPAMDRLQERYNDQLLILPISLDRKGIEVVDHFYKLANITHMPILMDSLSEARKRFQLRAFPTSFVINKERKVIAHIIGKIDWEDPNLLPLLGISSVQ